MVAILAIAAGVAVMAFDGNDRDRTVREARLFAAALEHAAARAQARAETLGASVDGATWRFWKRDADTGRWQPVGDDDILGPHALPDSVTLAPTSYSGRAVEPAVIVPFRASGRNEPFTFEVAGRGTRLVLSGDPLNRIAIVSESP